jgi:hypothetical protein
MPRIVAHALEQESVPTEPTVGARAEHERKSDGGELDNRDHDVGRVLHGDIDRVLRPGEPGFEERETRLHEKDERRRQDDSEEIQSQTQFIRR